MEKAIRIEKVKQVLLAMQRHSWEQGVAMQAFYEAGDEQTALLMAHEAVYRKVKDGRVAMIGNETAVTDPCSVGEVVLALGKKYQDAHLIKGHKQLLNWALKEAPRSQDGLVYHMMDSQQFWVDSMYMLPPYLVAAGHYKAGVDQLLGYYKRLYIGQKGLLGHMWDDAGGKWIRSDCWGTGNGWAMAAFARVIDGLPKDFQTEKKQLIHIATQLIERVTHFIQPNGMAHDVLDDPSSFLEINLPQMYAYTVYRGVYSGWLDSKYLEVANRCRLMAHTKVDDLGIVQSACGAPHFDRVGRSPEAQAFFILMESACSSV